MSANTSPPHILIVGAGVTGLLIAQGLKAAGIPFTVFECEPSLMPRGGRDWGVALHWAIPLLSSVLPAHLFAQLRTAQTDPFQTPPEGDFAGVYNGATGEVIKQMPFPRLYRFSRRKLRELCATDIPVQFGKALTGVEHRGDGVIAVFKDGTTAAGTVLIGSDGAKSAVRTLVLGERGALTGMPYVGCSVAIRFEDENLARTFRKMNSKAFVVHPNGLWSFVSVLDIPDDADPKTWEFNVMNSWKTEAPVDSPPSVAVLKERTTGLVQPYKAAVDVITPEHTVYGNRLSYWEPIPLGAAGKVVLAGDAAHPMTFHRGQGLGHAVADAVAFVEAVKKMVAGEEREAVMDAFELEVIKRGGEEVRVSKTNTEMVHDWQHFMDSPLMRINADRST